MNNLWVLVGLLVIVLGSLAWFWPTGEVASDPSSEPERILKTARWRWKMGDAVGAKRQLEVLRLLIADDEDKQATVRAVDRLISTIRNQRPTFQQKFVREAIDRAASLEKSAPEKARSILNGLLYLYEDDRSLADQISIVNERLKLLKQSAAIIEESDSTMPANNPDESAAAP